MHGFQFIGIYYNLKYFLMLDSILDKRDKFDHKWKCITLMLSEIHREKHKVICLMWVVTLTAPMTNGLWRYEAISYMYPSYSTCHGGGKPPLTDYSSGQWV